MLTSDDKKFLSAAEAGQTDTVKSLIEKGVDINIKDDHSGATAVSLAARRGQSGVVKFLLEKGAAVNILNSSGRSPLYAAIMGCADIDNTINTVKIFLEKDAGVDIIDYSGNSPLYWAVQSGN